MKKESGFTAAEFLVVVIILGGIGGWIANIAKIIASDFAQLTTLLVLRFVGVFIAPLGAVLGFV